MANGNVCDNILLFLGNMNRTSKVDLSIVKPLTKIQEDLTKKENAVIKLDYSKKTKFILFHSLKTQTHFISKLVERLENAEKQHENPEIVKDALDVFPVFSQIYNDTNTALNDKQNIDIYELDNLLTNFQILLMNKSLFPSQKEVLRGIKKSELKKEVQEIFKIAGDMVYGG